MIKKTLAIRWKLRKRPKTMKYRGKLWNNYSRFLKHLMNPINDYCYQKGMDPIIHPYHFSEVIMLLFDSPYCEMYRRFYVEFIQVLARTPYPSKEGFIGYDSFLEKLLYASAKVLDWASEIDHPEIFKNLRPGRFFLDSNDDFCYMDNHISRNIQTLLEPSKRMSEILMLTEYMLEYIFGMEYFKYGKQKTNNFCYLPSTALSEFHQDLVDEQIGKLLTGSEYIYYKKGQARKATRINLYKNMQLILLDYFAKLKKEEKFTYWY